MHLRYVLLLLTLFVLVDARGAGAQEATKRAVLPVSGELQDEVAVSIAIDESAEPLEVSAGTEVPPIIESGASVAADEDLVRLEELAIKEAVAFIAPSVVKIETLGGAEGSGHSTAICVSDAGLFLTAAYNLRGDPSSIFLKAASRAADGESDEIETKRFIAEIVATDHSRNLVLLKADPVEGFPFYPISIPEDELNLRTGETVIAVGKVYDERKPALSVGIVSALGRIWSRAIQTDAKISRANYGGPLITLGGDAAGILCPLSPDDTGVEAGAEWYDSGIGFAIPLAGYQRMIDQMAEGSDLHRGLLGVSMKAKDIHADEPVIGYCQPKSPATDAGLKPGDKVLMIGGKPLKSHAQMKHLLGPMIAGDNVEITLLRETETLTLTATLTDKIEPFEELTLGVVPAQTEGGKLKIAHVLSGGPGEKAGLKDGQYLIAIDGQELESWEDLQEKLNQLAPQQEIVLTVTSDSNDEDALAQEQLTITPDATNAAPPVNLGKTVELSSDDDAKAEVVEIKVADSSNRCFAIVPENDFAKVGKPALFVWVSEPGFHDSSEALKATAAACQRSNLVLMIPQSLDQKSWTPGEHEFISKSIQRLAKKVDFDATRVAIGGEKTAGTMACLTAFTNRKQFQGLVMFDALFPARLPQVETRPSERLLIYFANSEEFKSGERLDKITAALQKKKFPVHKNPGTFERLINILPEVADWTNTLDRH